jgi:glycosyltransferase involved in cell wall biosynthesis
MKATEQTCKQQIKSARPMSEKAFRVSVISSCFRGDAYLSSFIDQLVSQTLFPRLEWVLIHNEPSSYEMEIVKGFQQQFPEKIKHFVIHPVEPLSASWNRGWKYASGEYVSFWNLDDCRPQDSLQRQVETLERNLECAMTYGDYLEVPQYGSSSGIWKKTPPAYTILLQRIFPGGAFMVWRKNTAERLGYFDEQLTIACDYDLVTRAAVSEMKTCKTSGLVGYFTNEGVGLSTMKGTNKETVEKTVVQLRYAMFDKVLPENILDAENYRISEVLIDGHWFSLAVFVRNYVSYIRRRTFLQNFRGLRKFFMRILRVKG